MRAIFYHSRWATIHFWHEACQGTREAEEQEDIKGARSNKRSRQEEMSLGVICKRLAALSKLVAASAVAKGAVYL